MKIPNIKLSKPTRTAVNNILKESKKPHTIQEQMIMANYYGYLMSRPKSDTVDFAKILIGG